MLKKKEVKLKKDLSKILFLIFSTFSFCFSCAPTKSYKGTLIIEKSEELQSFSQIMSLEELYYMIENDKDFIIYIYSSNCLGCVEYTPMIHEFVSTHHYQIYGIDVDYENTKLNGRNTLIEFFETPTITVFDDGDVVERVCPSLFPDIFESKESLFNYFDYYLDF